MTVKYEIVVFPAHEYGEMDIEYFETTDAVSALETYIEFKNTNLCDPYLLVLRYNDQNWEDPIEYGVDECCHYPYSKLPKYVKTAMMKARPDIFEYLLTDY